MRLVMRSTAEILAIHRETYEAWQVEAREAGGHARAALPDVSTTLVPGRRGRGDVAVIRLAGFISQKPTVFSFLFGGTSTEQFAAEVVAAMRDESVAAVVVDVDSPGGSVFGVPEAARRIYNARGSKPLIAVANPIMASAAYYLASQADEIVATPSAVVGSIGVIAVHVDRSEALRKEGLKVTLITSGRRKAEGNQTEPLGEEARAAVQERLDYYGELFVSDVARGRRTSSAVVRTGYGEGAYFTAAKARDLGMVDRLATLEEIVGALAEGSPLPGRTLAAAWQTEINSRCLLAGIPLPKRPYDPVALRARAILAGVDWRPKGARTTSRRRAAR